MEGFRKNDQNSLHKHLVMWTVLTNEKLVNWSAEKSAKTIYNKKIAYNIFSEKRFPFQIWTQKYNLLRKGKGTKIAYNRFWYFFLLYIN